jgi:hypothetical protein
MHFFGVSNLIHNIKSNVAGAIRNVFRPLFVKVYFFILLAMNAVVWLSVYYISDRASGQLSVLHYNVDFGPDWMGRASQLYIMPVIGVAVLITNLFLLLMFYRRNDLRVLSHFLLGTALVVNFFLLMALGPIYLINFVY